LRVGVYSDVHANFVALRAVLDHYGTLGPIDWYVCLGDVVGYGPAPHQCCQTVRDHARYTVLGNHDAAVCGRMNYNYYYAAARNALDRHKAELSAEDLDWLSVLPYSVMHEDICFTHGSPLNEGSFEYVFTPDHARGLLGEWEALAAVTLMGHSHLTKSFRLPPPGSGEDVEELTGTTLDLSRPGKYVATVGSVGQPRDNDARACCTVLDTEARTLEYHRVDYDVYSAAESIWACDYLAPDFGKRLFLGV
jgi:predicted phosphodiesterase